MHTTVAEPIACPLDGLPLMPGGPTLQCGNGHSYDKAKDGYWNLLLVQHKASLDPGDTKEMVAARRRFLDAGHFAPIAGHVFSIVAAMARERPDGETLLVADAGCGEGYYLQELCRLAAADTSTGHLMLAGFDVSKWAVQAAARRKLPVTWLVANNRRPPFLAGSVDAMLCLFGFPVWEGFASVQKPGGAVILVDPGPDHLIELREVIYPQVERTGPPSLARAETAGYRLQHETALRFSFRLEGNAPIRDLAAMTPHGWRIPPAGRAALDALGELSVTADVVVRIVERKPDPAR